MAPGKTCLSAVVASLFVSGISLRSYEDIARSPFEQSPHHVVALTNSQNLLAADPNVIARFLETRRTISTPRSNAITRGEARRSPQECVREGIDAPADKRRKTRTVFRSKEHIHPHSRLSG